MARLSILALELAHEAYEGLDCLWRDRVVKRGAHAADRPVALYADNSRRCRFLDELFLDCFIAAGHAKYSVHSRARSLLDGTAVVAAAFDGVVKKLGLRFIALFDGREPALGLDPIEDQAHHVNGEGGRRMVERALFDVRAILEDFGDLFVRAFGEIATQDHHGCAGGPEIFLRAGKDQPKLPHFNRPRANI